MSGKRSLEAGPFREPAYSDLSSLWYTELTLPFFARDCSGRFLTTSGNLGIEVLGWLGRFPDIALTCSVLLFGGQ